MAYSYFTEPQSEPKQLETATKLHLSEEQIRDVVKDVIKNNPDLILQSVENYYQEKMLAEKVALKATLLSLKDKIFSNLSDPKVGHGKIKIAQFFDYACGYCKKALSVHKKLATDPDIQIIFKEMPIMGPISLIAAKAALAVNMIDSSKYQAFQEALLSSNLTGEDMIINIAGELGIDPIKLKETMEKPEINNMIQDNLALAADLQIRGTPAYVLDDEVLPGAVNYNDLRTIINSKKEGKAKDGKKLDTEKVEEKSDAAEKE
jgi:protein-disulfide isomerase